MRPTEDILTILKIGSELKLHYLKVQGLEVHFEGSYYPDRLSNTDATLFPSSKDVDVSHAFIPTAYTEPEILHVGSPLDDLTEDEILYYGTPYYEELQAKKEELLDKKVDQENLT